MDKDELLAAVDDWMRTSWRELAGDLPHQVVYEALQRRDEEERAQVKAAMSYEDKRSRRDYGLRVDQHPRRRCL